MTTGTLDRFEEPASMARHTPASLRHRALELLRTEIDFIPNPAFRIDALRRDVALEAVLAEQPPSDTVPSRLPAHLRGLCESELLSREQETALFRQMNLLKYRANVLRTRIDPEAIDPQLIELIESLLVQAQTIRNHVVRANMRLVISIVKKFVTPQRSFDDMLSDGILTLLQAVEKFDYDRGFRFSTYAYRSIARNAYRSLIAARKEEARFRRDAEQWAFELEDNESVSATGDQAWTHLRQLIGSMLEQLDRREQFIIRGRYALGGHRKVKTFQVLADKLGVSKERVRQLEQRAVAKLRAMAAKVDMDQLNSMAAV